MTEGVIEVGVGGLALGSVLGLAATNNMVGVLLGGFVGVCVAIVVLAAVRALCDD